jgi:hypothetical protein
MNKIKVLYFAPGAEAVWREVEEDHMAFRKLLGTDTLDATMFAVEGRMYYLWCDDFAIKKELPGNRRLKGNQYSWSQGWMMKGPFFITRILNECDVTITKEDIPYIQQFVDFQFHEGLLEGHHRFN